MSDRDFSAKEPVYEPDVHPEVTRECLEAWRQGHPWTQIRVLEKGTDNPSGQTCASSQGRFHEPCDKPVEAVQYTSAFGCSQFYCEEHALKQNDWDIIFYRGEKPVHEDDDPDAVEGETVADQVKRHRKKNKKPEPEEEYDP